MIIWGVSDLHGRLGVLENPPEHDLLLLAGDIFNPGQEKLVQDLLSMYSKYYAIPGNNETVEECRDVYGERCIHGRAVEFRGYKIYGYGGSPYTPFFTVNEWKDEKEFPPADIYLFHAPPAGTPLALTSSGADAGSLSIRRAIEIHAPLLCLCGHVHERVGEEFLLGRTRVVNVVGGKVVEVGPDG